MDNDNVEVKSEQNPSKLEFDSKASQEVRAGT